MATPEASIPRKYRKSSLTPAKQKFAGVYAKTDNAAEAVRQAYPEYASNTTSGAIRQKGYELLTNPDIGGEIMLQKEKMQRIAAKAVQRIEDIIVDGKEHNALQASMYAYDQTHGRATQQIEQTTKSVSILIDLTAGEAAGDVFEGQGV